MDTTMQKGCLLSECMYIECLSWCERLKIVNSIQQINLNTFDKTTVCYAVLHAIQPET